MSLIITTGKNPAPKERTNPFVIIDIKILNGRSKCANPPKPKSPREACIKISQSWTPSEKPLEAGPKKNTCIIRPTMIDSKIYLNTFFKKVLLRYLGWLYIDLLLISFIIFTSSLLHIHELISFFLHVLGKHLPC